jgi:hypothetical protein
MNDTIDEIQSKVRRGFCLSGDPPENEAEWCQLQTRVSFSVLNIILNKGVPPDLAFRAVLTLFHGTAGRSLLASFYDREFCDADLTTVGLWHD